MIQIYDIGIPEINVTARSESEDGRAILYMAEATHRPKCCVNPVHIDDHSRLVVEAFAISEFPQVILSLSSSSDGMNTITSQPASTRGFSNFS